MWSPGGWEPAARLCLPVQASGTLGGLAPGVRGQADRGSPRGVREARVSSGSLRADQGLWLSVGLLLGKQGGADPEQLQPPCPPETRTYPSKAPRKESWGWEEIKQDLTTPVSAWIELYLKAAQPWACQ